MQLSSARGARPWSSSRPAPGRAASSRTSSAAASSARRPTSSSATSPPSRASSSEPLAVLIQSSSAAGKSALMDAVLAFVPRGGAGQVLGDDGAVALLHGRDRTCGTRCSPSSKRRAPSGRATRSSCCRARASSPSPRRARTRRRGRLVTHEYRVEGPGGDPPHDDGDRDRRGAAEPLLGAHRRRGPRADRAPSTACSASSRRSKGCSRGEEREAISQLHRNAQRLLRPLPVVNPYAARARRSSTDQTRTRRDHMKYLDAHPRDRPAAPAPARGARRSSTAASAVEYVEVTLDDIALANRLAHEVLGRTLDELPPQTRRLLEPLDAHGDAELRAAGDRAQRLPLHAPRRCARRTGWGDTQLKVHLARLVELEYLLVAPRRPRPDATSTSCSTTARARTASPSCMG